MVWDWATFIIGLFSGGFVGVVIMALCNIASYDKRDNK